jgi:hypothetical protein
VPEPQIHFDAEGGFRVGNTYVPAEQVRRVVVAHARAAKMCDSWGSPVNEGATEEEIVRQFSQPRRWDAVDHGNLKRIAIACERQTELLEKLLALQARLALDVRSLERTIVACLQPALAITRQRQQEVRQQAEDRFHELLAPLTLQHGKPPRELLRKMWADFIAGPIDEAISGPFVPGIDGYIDDLRERVVWDELALKLPPGAKNSAVRKLYDDWLKRGPNGLPAEH